MTSQEAHDKVRDELAAAREKKLAATHAELERLRSAIFTKGREWGRTQQELDAIVYP